jgi:hypothetical protein
MTLVRFKKAVDPRLIDAPTVELRKVRRSQWESAVDWAEFKAHGYVEALTDLESGSILILYSDSARMDRLQAWLAGALFDATHCPFSYNECVEIAGKLVLQSISTESVVWL